MANAIDTYSYGLGLEHGTELNRVIEARLAHSLALIEDMTRDVLAGKANTVELLYLVRDVLHV